MGIHHLHFLKQSQTQPRYMISRNQRLTASCLMDRLPQYSSSNTYYRMTAANFSVNKDVMNDVSLFATSTDYVKTDSCDIVDELKKLQSEKTVYRGDKAESFLETIISNVSVDTEKAETYNKLYSNLEQTIANQRTSVSGVDEDEEALNLVKF